MFPSSTQRNVVDAEAGAPHFEKKKRKEMFAPTKDVPYKIPYSILFLQSGSFKKILCVI
jgi:hypothetical protein